MACERCPRLARFRVEVGRKKRREFREWEYWSRPVPGFGDPRARLVVIGLAPAAHGGNRTGRVFTGDPSAQFLMRHLHEAGFSSRPDSLSRDDGLRLRDAYITAAVKCVPPDNKPTTQESENCSEYLDEELTLLSSARVILALGKFAFEAYRGSLARRLGTKTSHWKFRHGAVYRMGAPYPTLFASYHPSPRNTNTGTLTPAMFRSILRLVRKEIESTMGKNEYRSRNDL